MCQRANIYTTIQTFNMSYDQATFADLAVNNNPVTEVQIFFLIVLIICAHILPLGGWGWSVKYKSAQQGWCRINHIKRTYQDLKMYNHKDKYSLCVLQHSYLNPKRKKALLTSRSISKELLIWLCTSSYMDCCTFYDTILHQHFALRVSSEKCICQSR